MTPLVTQYHELKRREPDTILFFVTGQLVEVVGDDVERLCDVLGLLYNPTAGREEDGVSISGFPFRYLKDYLRELVAKGHRAAVCEQVGAKSAKGKHVERITTLEDIES